jgi:hypothetical protein
MADALRLEQVEPQLEETERLQLWLFEEAPEKYRMLSENGGDEDWVMFVPDRLEDHRKVVRLIDSTAFDSGCAPEEHDVDGGIVYIGCHA